MLETGVRVGMKLRYAFVVGADLSGLETLGRGAICNAINGYAPDPLSVSCAKLRTTLAVRPTLNQDASTDGRFSSKAEGCINTFTASAKMLSVS